MKNIEENLAKLGFTVPTRPKPAAHYPPFTMSDSLTNISGQLPLVECGALPFCVSVKVESTFEALP